MTTVKMKMALKGMPEISRSFFTPSDISFLDLHMLVQAIAGWEEYYRHRFVIGDTAIGAGREGVSEEANVSLEDYKGTDIVYEYGPFTLDISFLKGSFPDAERPRVVRSRALFPSEAFETFDEYREHVNRLNDPDGSVTLGDGYLRMECDCRQNVVSLNGKINLLWERTEKIRGRIPFDVSLMIFSLYFSGSDDYYYDTEEENVVEGSDGSGRYLPIIAGDNEVLMDFAAICAETLGIQTKSPFDELMKDEHIGEWIEFASEYHDEIVSGWARGFGYMVGALCDCDGKARFDRFPWMLPDGPARIVRKSLCG